MADQLQTAVYRVVQAFPAKGTDVLLVTTSTDVDVKLIWAPRPTLGEWAGDVGKLGRLSPGNVVAHGAVVLIRGVIRKDHGVTFPVRTG
jgi:hypothetical protein